MKLCECGCGKEIIWKPWHKHTNVRFIRGHQNRGKKSSVETRNKISESLLGKTGKDSRNYGNRYSEEVRNKMSETRKGKNSPNYGKHLSEKTKKKIGDAQKGELANNWQGGVSFGKYCPKFNHQLKEEIRNQYDRKCQICKKDESEIMKDAIERNKRPHRLYIHHISMDKQEGCNGKTFELIPLCGSCHSKLHNRRD